MLSALEDYSIPIAHGEKRPWCMFGFPCGSCAQAQHCLKLRWLEDASRKNTIEVCVMGRRVWG